jgi:hypothetical protein
MTEARVVELVGAPSARLRMNGRTMLYWRGEARQGLFGRSRPIALAVIIGRDGRLDRPLTDIQPPLG